MTNYGYAQAAAELGCSEAWLREHTPKRPLPHLKFGGSNGPVVFTDQHLEQIRRMQEVQPEPVGGGLRPVQRRKAS